VEPFTLIVYEHGNLYELRWNGAETYLRDLAVDQPHIYSSATLYTEEAISTRDKWFNEWLMMHHAFTVQEIRDFHSHAGEDNSDNALVMNRSNIVQTVSITSIEKKVDSVEMIYHDILNDKTTLKRIEFEKNQ